MIQGSFMHRRGVDITCCQENALNVRQTPMHWIDLSGGECRYLHYSRGNWFKVDFVAVHMYRLVTAKNCATVSRHTSNEEHMFMCLGVAGEEVRASKRETIGRMTFINALMRLPWGRDPAR